MTSSLKKPKEYIAWENINIEWGWSWVEVSRVIELWQEGKSANEITRELKRPFIETWLLIANLIWSSQIEPKAKIFCLPYSLRPKNKISLFY